MNGKVLLSQSVKEVFGHVLEGSEDPLFCLGKLLSGNRKTGVNGLSVVFEYVSYLARRAHETGRVPSESFEDFLNLNIVPS